MEKILVTGGAGFIGANLVKYLVKQYPQYQIINLDALTYAANLAYLTDIAQADNYQFIKADITDFAHIQQLMQQYQPNKIIHLAAQTHVDSSIAEPLLFSQTNVLGTANLLTAANQIWHTSPNNKLFLHMSTDEVFGSLGADGYFNENSAYSPNSPYSASKAGADHLVRAFNVTYGLPYIIAHSSNNYGLNQHREKLIPKTIACILAKQPIPIYGTGTQRRDWLYVQDCVKALDLLLHKGQLNSSYNLGANNEWANLDLVRLICQLMDEQLQQPAQTAQQLINYVADRPGHDYRYALNCQKIKKLSWKTTNFTANLKTIISTIVKNSIKC